MLPLPVPLPSGRFRGAGPSFLRPSKNVGTYAPSFGALCAVTFEVERERAPAKNIPGPDEPKVHVRLVPSGRGV